MADQKIINWMQYQSAGFDKFIQFTKVLYKIVIYYSISNIKNSELRFSKIMHLKYIQL